MLANAEYVFQKSFGNPPLADLNSTSSDSVLGNISKVFKIFGLLLPSNNSNCKNINMKYYLAKIQNLNIIFSIFSNYRKTI